MKGKILVLTSALMACTAQAVWAGSTPASRLQFPGVRVNPPMQSPAIQESPDIPSDLWTPAKEPAKPLSYFVQAGIFSKLMRALLVVASIEPKFPKAFIATRRSAGADLYQVRIGPFRSRAEAEEAVHWLESLGHEARILRPAGKQFAFRVDPR